MQSLYARYSSEREGHEFIEEPWGFIEYTISGEICLIHSIYIIPEERLSGKGSELANRVTQIALDKGCKFLWSQVWVSMLNSTDSLLAILGYGFKLAEAANGRIILTKQIGG